MARRKPSKAQMAQWAAAAHRELEIAKEQPSNDKNEPSTATAVARVSITKTWVSSRMTVTRRPLPESRPPTTPNTPNMFQRRQLKRREEEYRKKQRMKELRKNVPRIVITTPDGSNWEPDDMPEWQPPHRSWASELLHSQWESREKLSPLRCLVKKRRPRRHPKSRLSQRVAHDRPPAGCKLWA